MDIRLFEDENKFIKESVSFILDCCGAKNSKIALSGGSTPQKTYLALAKSDLPFEKASFFQVDERYVSKNHKDSNFKMINEALIKPAGNRIKEFHYFDTSVPIEESLKKYEKELKNVKFDLIILGIGTDGHTASLFPGCDTLKEEKKLVAHTITETQTIKDRLTITFPVIMKSKKILVLLKGKGKKDILNEILNSKLSIDDYPAKKLLEHPELNIFYCPK